MLVIIPISIFAFIVFTSVGLYWAFFRPASEATQRLEKLRYQYPDDEDAPPIMEESPVVKAAERVAEPINRIMPPSAEVMGKLRKKLIHAGYRSSKAPAIFRAIQVVSIVAFPAFSMFQAWIINSSYFKPTLSTLAMSVFSGYLAPRKFLDSRVNKRQLHLQWGLADALDLLVVSIEAGLGMNQAMMRIAKELRDVHPEICEEFDMVNNEIRVGREREEALRNMAERTGVDDLRGLCAMLIQADRFGTSIGRAIRVYADSLRTKRRQRAEQAAQKAAMKLLMPLALFLFPTLFIILLGPAGMQFMDHFNPHK
ncbi:MAG: type II secretion system F family protein [Blastocatellia bacterium]|nr:type II secretion system F family protein [Blastocatellia bacterium]